MQKNWYRHISWSHTLHCDEMCDIRKKNVKNDISATQSSKWDSRRKSARDSHTSSTDLRYTSYLLQVGADRHPEALNPKSPESTFVNTPLSNHTPSWRRGVL
ncbi:uncharacterized protein PRCAT00006330001 [Priceomyces carsonii]|uniref:uncharacterized protein n=1 Tax=Priceomyces carsonii TaxID=28549 RepID=UPI002EDA87D3|nr:unnamed protein product [Priceomyces carsonii]